MDSTQLNSKAKKFDADKLRYDLIIPEMNEAVAQVLTYGASKYGDNNWKGEIDCNRLYAAAIRHLEACRKGEPVDSESNLPHLAHAATNILMWLWHSLNHE